MRRIQRAPVALHGGIPVIQREQRLAIGHQNLGVVPVLLGQTYRLKSVIAIVEFGVGACHVGIDQRIVRANRECVFQCRDGIAVAMHAVQSVRQCQMGLNIIRREFESCPIFDLCLLQHHFLAVCLRHRQVGGSRFAQQACGEFRFLQSWLRAAQLQIRESQPQMSLSIIRPQFKRFSEIFLRL